MPESQDDVHADFRRTQKWRDKLHKSVCHKSLDIPEDDDLNITQHGITGRHLVVLAGIILTGLLGWRALNLTNPGVPPSVNSVTSYPAVQEYEVRFWLDDGTEIEIQPLRGYDGELAKGPE